MGRECRGQKRAVNGCNQEAGTPAVEDGGWGRGYQPGISIRSCWKHPVVIRAKDVYQARRHRGPEPGRPAPTRGTGKAPA